MNRLVAIVGPTGIGKSQLSIKMAQIFHGEIVNADSRQVYRCMDIGTAKSSAEELTLVPHHLINIVDPGEDFSLAQYRELADKAIKDIHSRNKLPLLVGGTGQYVRAVIEGWHVPHVAPDMELRRALEKKAIEQGASALYLELLEVDPAAARKIDKRNVRRVIRALEVHRQSGAPFSQLRTKEAPVFKTLIIGLTTNREEVYCRVDRRVDEMIKRGLVAEVEKLVGAGHNLSLPSMSGIGYRQIDMFLQSELSLEEAVQQIKTETHRVVRHQYAWFRLNDERIHWFDIQKDIEPEIQRLVSCFLEDKQT